MTKQNLKISFLFFFVTHLLAAPNPFDPKYGWMDRVIEKNFLPFSAGIDRESIDRTEHAQHVLVRLKVIQNKVFGPSGAGYAMLEYLAHTYGLPDLDLLYWQHDGISESIPGGAPIFVSSKQCWVDQGLYFVDWYTVMPHPDWDDMVEKINQTDLTWEKKRSCLIWRGRPTDGVYSPDNWTQYPRGKLCSLSLVYPQLINARFTALCPYTCVDPEELAKHLPFSEPMSLEDQVGYRYQMICDGIFTTFPGDRWRLLSNSVCFKPESTLEHWFYAALIPWVHYVPVKKDLSDLVQKLTFIHLRPRLAKNIARNAREFALNYLLSEQIAIYCYKALLKYATLQNYFKVPSSSTAENCRRVS